MNLKPYYIAVTLLVFIGFIISMILFPREREIALMNLEDKRFQEALKLYEARFNRGDHSITTVNPLSKLYLQYGQVHKASEIMETYVQTHPKDIKARERLGVLYQHSQRTGDYLKNLEVLAEIAPSPDRLRQLSYIYNFNGQFDKQIEVLKRLIQDFHGNEQDHLDLAFLQAEREKFDEAVPTIKKVISKDPKRVSIDTIEFGVTLMLDDGQEEQAMTLAQNYIKAVGGIRAALRLSARMRYKKRSDLALKLLTPYIDQADSNTRLLTELIIVQMNLKLNDEAFERLNRLFKKETLPDDALISFVELATIKKDKQLLEQIIDRAQLNLLPEGVLHSFAQTVLMSRDPVLAKKLKKNVNPKLIDADPTLSVILAVATEDPRAAEKLEKIQRNPNFTDRDRIFLAQILYAHGNKNYAHKMLSNVTELYYDKDIQLFDTVQLFIELGLQKKAYELLEKARAEVERIKPFERQSIYAWALLSTATGRTNDVKAWLAQDGEIDPQLLRDMHYMAIQAKKPDLSMIIADRLFKSNPSLTNRMYYAEALVANKRYAEALPHLKILSEKKGFDWFFVYAEALEKMGRKGDLSRLWKTHYQKQKWTPKELRNVAYILLKNGHKKDAEEILMKLAARSGPKSADTQQLLYIWGPRPQKYAIKWLEQQANNSSGKTRELWVKYMTDTGSTSLLESMIEANYADVPPEMIIRYWNEVSDDKDKSKLIKLAKLTIENEKSPARLVKVGRIALYANAPNEAEAIFKRAIEIDPNYASVYRELGRLTLFKARYTEAEKYFKAYFDAGGEDYATYFYYAQLMLRDKNDRKALKYYNKSKELLDVLPQSKKSIKTDLMEAQILYNQGKTEEAIARYKKLVKNRPSNKELRVDVLYLLMDAGRYKDAERILSGLQT